MDIHLVISVLGLVLQCAVMVVVPVRDGRFMKGGLLRGGVPHRARPETQRAER